MDAAAFPRQFARTRRFSLGLPHRFTVSPDGERVLFLRTGGAADPVARLWLYAGGEERMLADPERLGSGGGLPAAERVRRERERTRTSGVTAYAVDAAARLAAFALNGALWAVRTDGSPPFAVPSAGAVVDPRPSPDGRDIAYVTGGALHVVAADGSGDRAVAAPESAEVTYGLSEHVGAESMHRYRGYWWAPDGGTLLVARADESPVQRWYFADPADPAAEPHDMRYPAAGTANADVSLHLITLTGGRTEVDWDRKAYEYLATAGWDEHGPLIGVQSRDQRRLHTLAVDPDTGATTLLHEEHDTAWTRLTPGAPARTGSGALVNVVVDSDTYRLAVAGEPVTPAGLQVRAVLAVTGERVLFAASDDPAERHVWSYEPGTGSVRLSEGPGLHSAAAGGGTLVLESSTPAGTTARVLAGGRAGERIASLGEEPVVTPRPVHLPYGTGQLRSTLYLPSWHEPGSGKLPVLLDPYGGPGMRKAGPAREWWTVASQWFAEQGFAVLVTDGRGTPGSPSWERAVRGNKRDFAVADQVEALHTAAGRHQDLDLGRVAIRGWSFGGFLAAAAVLTRPDTFHAAIAGAPVTDMRLYDTHWQERFLGHPDEEPENYTRSSLTGLGHLLRRPLLLIHGLADDNVAAAHTLRLSAELLAAGRQHCVLPLPGESHMVTDEKVNENLLGFQLDFLRRELNTGRAAPV